MFFLHRDNTYSIGVPLFIGPGYADPAGMTIASCAAFCDSQLVPYRFMGITDGFLCGTSLAQDKTLTLETEMP